MIINLFVITSALTFYYHYFRSSMLTRSARPSTKSVTKLTVFQSRRN